MVVKERLITIKTNNNFYFIREEYSLSTFFYSETAVKQKQSHQHCISNLDEITTISEQSVEPCNLFFISDSENFISHSKNVKNNNNEVLDNNIMTSFLSK